MQFHISRENVLIIDFGSQLTKLIARRVRELGVFCEILNPKDFKKIENFNNIKGIILSGGPSSVTKKSYQSIPKSIFQKKIPILGICYGLQLIAKLHGGKIKSSKKRESLAEHPFLKKKVPF